MINREDQISKLTLGSPYSPRKAKKQKKKKEKEK